MKQDLHPPPHTINSDWPLLTGRPYPTQPCPGFPFRMEVPFNGRGTCTKITLTAKIKKKKKGAKSWLILGCLDNQAVGIIGGCCPHPGTKVHGLEQVRVHGRRFEDPLVVTGSPPKGNVRSSVGI